MTRLHLLPAIALLAACPADDPEPKLLDGRVDAVRLDGTPDSDGAACAVSWSLPNVGVDNPSCTVSATDFNPKDVDNDGWDPCVSDDNTYHRFEPNISSIARVAAFESVVALLLKAKAPSPQDFFDARLAYSPGEGLFSRVTRREDEHYPPAAKKCRDMDDAERQAHKDRCVGPTQIEPLVNAAFVDGISGKNPWLNAARIESALLWFLYVSTYKEAITCTDRKKDCDSSYAYYTGGDARAGGRGLARYVRAVSPRAHDRVWDGLLAVRCWRELDGAVPAENLALRDRAMAQLDRGLLRGLAVIVMSRVKAAREASCPTARAALWESVRVLGNVLLREANERDATAAAALKRLLSGATASDADLNAVSTTLQKIFPCP